MAENLLELYEQKQKENKTAASGLDWDLCECCGKIKKRVVCFRPPRLFWRW